MDSHCCVVKKLSAIAWPSPADDPVEGSTPIFQHRLPKAGEVDYEHCPS